MRETSQITSGKLEITIPEKFGWLAELPRPRRVRTSESGPPWVFLALVIVVTGFMIGGATACLFSTLAAVVLILFLLLFNDKSVNSEQGDSQ